MGHALGVHPACDGDLRASTGSQQEQSRDAEAGGGMANQGQSPSRFGAATRRYVPPRFWPLGLTHPVAELSGYSQIFVTRVTPFRGGVSLRALVLFSVSDSKSQITY